MTNFTRNMGSRKITRPYKTKIACTCWNKAYTCKDRHASKQTFSNTEWRTCIEANSHIHTSTKSRENKNIRTGAQQHTLSNSLGDSQATRTGVHAHKQTRTNICAHANSKNHAQKKIQTRKKGKINLLQYSQISALEPSRPPSLFSTDILGATRGC